MNRTPSQKPRWRRGTLIAVTLAVVATTFAAVAGAAPGGTDGTNSSPNTPPGPVPVLHVGTWSCSDWQISNCGEVTAAPNTDMYYNYYGTWVGSVHCSESPWGHAPNEHFPFNGFDVVWSVQCLDDEGNGFSKQVTVRLAPGYLPPGPIPELHIGSWICRDWRITDCGTVTAAPGTKMYYVFYGNVSGGVTCTESPWGHPPNISFPYPGQDVVWSVSCRDAQQEGFDKYVHVIPG
jgi:hypothetical protein